MLKPSKDTLQEALTTNSFDIGSTDRTLRMALDHSFSYLYRLQRSMIDYEEYFYTTRNVINKPDYGDMYIDNKGRVCINFGVSLILPQFREKFRQSKWYNKEIDYDDFSKEHSLFVRLPIITIDGGILRNFKIQIFDSYFVAVLPYNKNFLYDKKYNKEEGHHYYIDHTCVLQVIKNGDIFDVNTNSGMIQRNSYDGASFNRIRMDYIQNFGITVDPKSAGSYFVALYTDNDIGTYLQDVDIDEAGDFVIHYDLKTLDFLKSATKPITIRFFFFRNLIKHYGYRGQKIPVREYDGSPLSEIFMLQKDEAVQYDMPIPIENLMIFKMNADDVDPKGNHKTWNLISNCSVDINYPNIYKVRDEVDIGDFVTVYYFYHQGYDLSYRYMYDFYFKYLYYKFGGPIDSIVNALYFKDIDVEKLIKLVWADPVKSDIASLFINDGALERTEIENLCNFIIGLSEIEPSTTPNSDYDLYFGDATLDEDGSIVECISLIQFWDIFKFIINHPIVDYRYDDIDYLKNYQTTLTPFEYKVSKLKEFIADDINILRDYVLEQKKVGISYGFFTYEIDMDKHKVDSMASSKKSKFSVPMYMFCFDNSQVDMGLGVRIFIDGLFYDKFSEENYKFSKYVYIPVDDIPENAFIEFELFYSYKDKKEIFFNSMDSSIILEYPSDKLIPTLSDLRIIDKADENMSYSKDLFRFEVVSDKYDYYINGHDGETSNVFPVEFDSLYGTFSDVEYGKSTLNIYNKGVTHSNTNVIRITPLYDDVLGKELIVVVDKSSDFVNKGVGAEERYPFFEIAVDKRNINSEYIRLFKDGRLISKNKYDITDKNGHFGVQSFIRTTELSSTTLDVTPYRNRLILYKKELESDLIDLRGYINKPFDINYFDVYLNGRKLSKNNICPISAWEIKLFGLHSIHNLEIYEKDRDWEYYGVDFSNYFTLSDLIDKKFIEDYIIEKLIRDKTGDVPGNDDSEEPQEWDKTITLETLYFEMFYYDRLLPLKFVCADLLQFELDDILTNFERLWDNHSASAGSNNPSALLLNPDVRDPDNEGGQIVYMMGNSDAFIENLMKGDDGDV